MIKPLLFSVIIDATQDISKVNEMVKYFDMQKQT
jgi:hypothetical protein